MSDKTSKAWEALEEIYDVMQDDAANVNVTAAYGRAALAAAAALVAFVEAYEIVHGTNRRRPAENDTETRGDEGP